MFSLTNQLNTLTIELSAFGHLTPDQKAYRPFEPGTLRHMAAAILKSVKEYTEPGTNKEPVRTSELLFQKVSK